MSKRLLGLFILMLAPFSLLAQSPSSDFRFGGHALGEPADAFFSTARVADSKLLAKDYCAMLLDDPKVKEKAQEKDNWDKNGGVFTLSGKDLSVLDVGNCREMLAALRGEQAHVGARLASELGSGHALFASGKLRALDLTVNSTYAQTVADMDRRFGTPGKADTVSRIGWPPLREMRWERDGVLAAVWQVPSSDHVVALVGFLEPPYDSFLRGTPAPESSVGAPSSTATCKAQYTGASQKLRVSQGVMTGLIVHRIPPLYPESARHNRIEGVVVLGAIIDECGHVVELKPISGPEELSAAAMTAVKQWEYKPYLSSGQATPVETQVQVNFTLSH